MPNNLRRADSPVRRWTFNVGRSTFAFLPMALLLSFPFAGSGCFDPGKDDLVVPQSRLQKIRAIELSELTDKPPTTGPISEIPSTIPTSTPGTLLPTTVPTQPTAGSSRPSPEVHMT